VQLESRTREGWFELYDISTGEVLARAPIDAKAQVRSTADEYERAEIARTEQLARQNTWDSKELPVLCSTGVSY
jgi:hypothetical protein